MSTEPNSDAFDDSLRWVRTLARSLVVDPSLAEDLTQETMLVAIERAPRHSPSLRSWLARVLRNRLWLHRRTEDRRRRREQTVARAETATPTEGELLERVEAVEQLADAVRQLPEPYRRVVLLRYFDDLPNAEIARRLGVPNSTIRTRLDRARSRLKELLDAEFGNRKRWCQALLPIAGLPETSALTATTLLSTGTGLFTMKKLTAALVLVALLIGGYAALDSEPKDSTDELALRSGSATTSTDGEAPSATRDEPTPPRELGDASTGATEAAGRSTNGDEPGADSDDSSASDAKAPPEAVVTGHIYRTDGVSLEGARVFLWGGDQPGSVIDAEGNFRIATRSDMARSFFLEEAGWQVELGTRVRPSFSEETVVEIEVDPGFSTTLELIDRDHRRAVPNAKYTVRRFGDGQASALLGSVDEDGTTRLSYLPEGSYKVEIDHPDYAPEEFRFEVPREDSVVCELSPARSLEITLENYASYPAPNRVYLQLSDGKGANLIEQGQPNEYGEMTMKAPPPGKWRGEVFAGGEFPRVRFNLAVGPGETPVRLSVELPERSSNRLVARILDGVGDPIPPKGRIIVGKRAGELQSDGTVVIENVDPGEQSVRWVVGSGNERVERDLPSVTLPDELELQHDFVIEGEATLAVSLLGLTGPLSAEHHVVQVHHLSGEAQQRLAWGVGSLREPLNFERLPLGRYEAELWLGGGHGVLPLREIELKKEGVTEASVELPRPSNVALTFDAPSSATLPGVVLVQLHRGNERAPQYRTVEIRDGAASFILYGEGNVEVHLNLEGFGLAKRAVELRHGSTTEAVVKLVPQ